MGETGKRILSAAVLIPPVLAAVHFGQPYFEALALVFAALMVWEWYKLSARQPMLLVAGWAYIALAVYFIHLVRYAGGAGPFGLYLLFTVTWVTDTGAYVIGRSVGGLKLAPRISPSKTLSGALGGLIFGVMAAILLWFLAGFAVDARLVVFAVVYSVACQIGDLVESAAKRHFGVKDSGNLIPGHGGILDRVDGLLGAAVAAGIMYALDGPL
ncbi:MAG: phosphatidate cytidylyltransferase [Rhodospirillaceae bacterium]